MIIIPGILVFIVLCARFSYFHSFTPEMLPLLSVDELQRMKRLSRNALIIIILTTMINLALAFFVKQSLTLAKVAIYISGIIAASASDFKAERIRRKG